MMTTTIDRNAAEAALSCALNIIGRAGVRSMSTLRSVPGLHTMFIDALHTWMLSVGFATSSCASIIRSHNTSADDMAGDLLARLLNPERRICRVKGRTLAQCVDASLHPAMDYVLNMAVTADAATVVKYLMRMVHNFCVEKFREQREEQQRTVQSDPETLRHGDANALDSGAVRKHPVAADSSDGGLMRRETMAAAFSCFDGDFLHDAALLGDALGVPRQRLADIIYSGRCHALACQLVKRVNAKLGGDFTDAFATFLQSARSYMLPEKYRMDPKALLRALYRATSTASRQEMKRRIVERTA